MKVLILILFMCGFAYGQEFRNEEMYLKDTVQFDDKPGIDKIRAESSGMIRRIIEKYPDYDSLAYLDFVSVFAMDSLNQYRKSLGLDTMIFNSELMYELVDDCIFEYVDKVKKPVLVKTVFDDVCSCWSCYRDLVSEIFLHEDVMKRLKSKNLQNFNIAIFYMQGKDYIFCVETEGVLFNIRTYIE